MKVRFLSTVDGDRTNPAGYAAGSEWWLGDDQALAFAEAGLCEVVENDPVPSAESTPLPSAADVADLGEEE